MPRSILPALLVLLVCASLYAAEGVDESPLPVKMVDAFPKLRFVRPLVLTHAGDGTNRVFVVSQLGSIHVFPNDQAAAKAKVFLDISKRVVYKEKENEEGLLGLAFHPRYKANGYFFVYYSTTESPHTTVVSRFRVASDDPDRADPASELELLRVPHPFWNHKGGTICFGPDGYLYIAIGDGGSANDPHRNGQNLRTPLAKILRIDVDHRDEGKQYAVPKDNPFANSGGAALPEIYAYGLRNVWRMAFDRQTGALWAADVGQDTWEEIDLIVPGGNYGWNLREGRHVFVPKGGKAHPDAERNQGMIDPIWEYHHDIGKSITGGHVYRGSRVPELVGHYLYADYVTGKLWALRYDEAAGKVVANHPIAGNIKPVFSFGEDEAGDVYFMVDAGTLHRFAPGKP
jgi:quinoprotein glucose dehydrogenase